jgi:Trehalose-phosphatase
MQLDDHACFAMPLMCLPGCAVQSEVGAVQVLCTVPNMTVEALCMIGPHKQENSALLASLAACACRCGSALSLMLSHIRNLEASACRLTRPRFYLWSLKVLCSPPWRLCKLRPLQRWRAYLGPLWKTISTPSPSTSGTAATMRGTTCASCSLCALFPTCSWQQRRRERSLAGAHALCTASSCDSVHASCTQRNGASRQQSTPALQVKSAVDAIAARHDDVHVTRGRKVLELRPSVAWDKGRALLHLLEALGLAGVDDVVPIYIGDDRTDEDAFEVLKGWGVGILVSTVAKPTAATFSLADPDEVRGACMRHLAFCASALVLRTCACCVLTHGLCLQRGCSSMLAGLHYLGGTCSSQLVVCTLHC